MKFIVSRKKSPVLPVIWLLQGIIVGFGAILPGISGGTLCVAFGMYRPIIETLADIRNSIKKHGLMIAVFGLGICVGFVGLSGMAAWMLSKNTVLVTCAFIGFIIGTFPELWKDAGLKGHGKVSIFFMVGAFLLMMLLLGFLEGGTSFSIAAGTTGYLFCGLLWGLSFIVPGLSSSSLLLFFGLYQPMLEGIAGFDIKVLLPLGIGMAACVLLLSKGVGYAYKKYFSNVSHGVLGIIAATAVMILPAWPVTAGERILYVLMIILGAAVSYVLTGVCGRLKESQEIVENNELKRGD